MARLVEESVVVGLAAQGCPWVKTCFLFYKTSAKCRLRAVFGVLLQYSSCDVC